MSHQLIGLLGRCIKADRVVDIVVNRKRHFGITAIHGAGGGVNEVFHIVMPAAFQNVPEADQFQDGPNYGTAGITDIDGFCNGGIIGAVQAGSGISITAYHVPRSKSGVCSKNTIDNPTTPFGRANLTLTPVPNTQSCDRN